jgi:hypothetical protein
MSGDALSHTIISFASLILSWFGNQSKFDPIIKRWSAPPRWAASLLSSCNPYQRSLAKTIMQHGPLKLSPPFMAHDLRVMSPVRRKLLPPRLKTKLMTIRSWFPTPNMKIDRQQTNKYLASSLHSY